MFPGKWCIIDVLAVGQRKSFLHIFYYGYNFDNLMTCSSLMYFEIIVDLI